MTTNKEKVKGKKRKKKAALPNTKMTIKEFRSMLNGMDLINGGTDWIPTAEQWEQIRDCIERIDDVVISTPTQQPTQQAVRTEPTTQEILQRVQSAVMYEEPIPEFVVPADLIDPTVVDAVPMSGTVPNSVPSQQKRLADYIKPIPNHDGKYESPFS